MFGPQLPIRCIPVISVGNQKVRLDYYKRIAPKKQSVNPEYQAADSKHIHFTVKATERAPALSCIFPFD